jgi:hypothetical protein
MCKCVSMSDCVSECRSVEVCECVSVHASVCE